MTPAQTVSLLDPVLWAMAWFAGKYGVRVPRNSWLRLLILMLSLGGFWGVVVLQIHFLSVLEPAGLDRESVGVVLAGEFFPAIVVLFWSAIREQRAMRQSTRD